MHVYIGKKTAVGKALLDWWEKLEEDRGSRAELRRAHSVASVVLTPAYQRMYRRLRSAGWPEQSRHFGNDRLAAVAALLAHVKQNSDDSPAKAMSKADEGSDRPYVSELRFRRLIESPDLDALFTGLRRSLPLMKHRVDILALANDIVYWGDDVKKRWAYDYEWPVTSND